MTPGKGVRELLEAPQNHIQCLRIRELYLIQKMLDSVCSSQILVVMLDILEHGLRMGWCVPVACNVFSVITEM